MVCNKQTTHEEAEIDKLVYFLTFDPLEHVLTKAGTASEVR